MNTKSLIFSTITGTVAYYLLGWLFYGIIFPGLYPEPEHMLFILLGSICYVLVFAIIYVRWANISTFKTGAVAGLILGLLFSISMTFFMSASSGLNLEHLATEAFIGAVSTAITGGVIGLTIGKTE